MLYNATESHSKADTRLCSGRHTRKVIELNMEYFRVLTEHLKYTDTK